jgi:hypothetical protein
MNPASARTAIKSRVHRKPSASTTSAAPAGQHESAGQSRLDAPVSPRNGVDPLPTSILNLQRTAGNQATQGLLRRINRVVQREHQPLGWSPVIQRSQLSDRVDKAYGKAKDAGAVIELIRQNAPHVKSDTDLGAQGDTDLRKWLADNLAGDDLWLANKLLDNGPELFWSSADLTERSKHGGASGKTGYGPATATIGTSSGLESARKLPIQAFFFPGQTDERALVIGGVHGSELSGVEVANRLVKDLQKMAGAHKLPKFTTIVVPELFPESAAKARAHARAQPGSKGEDSNVGREVTPDPALWKKEHPGEAMPKEIPVARQYPAKGQTWAQEVAAGGPTDEKGKRLTEEKGSAPLPLLNETAALMNLIERFNPSRITSVHAHRFDESFGAHRGQDAPGIFVDPVGGFDTSRDPNFPAKAAAKALKQAINLRSKAQESDTKLAKVRAAAVAARRKADAARAAKNAAAEALEKAAKKAEAQLAAETATNVDKWKKANEAKADAENALEKDAKKRNTTAFTATNVDDDKLALAMAEEASKGGARVPGSHLGESGPPVVHYADSVKPPPGRSLGGWGPEHNMTVITVEVEHYFDSEAFGKDPARAKELQAHTDAIRKVFLDTP